MFKPTLRFQLNFEGSWPTSVAFLGSGRRVAAGNQLGQIYVWDLPETPPAFNPKAARDRQAPDVNPVRRLDGHTNEITRLLTTADAKHLVSSSLDKTIRVWPIDGKTSGKSDVILDADTRRREARRTGKKEVNGGPTVSVTLQTESRTLEGHGDWIHALALSGDSKRAISGDAAGQVIVWDLATNKPISKWAGHPWNWIIAAALSADGKTALVSEYRYKRDDFDVPAPGLKIWEVDSAKVRLDFLAIHYPKLKITDRSYGASQQWRKFFANGLITAALSPDGKLAALGQGGETDTGKVHLLDTSTGKLVRTVSGHMGGVTDILFTADGKQLVSVGRDTSARIVQVSDGKELAVAGSPRGGQFKDWLSAVALSPDSRFLAAADIAGLIQIWELSK